MFEKKNADGLTVVNTMALEDSDNDDESFDLD